MDPFIIVSADSHANCPPELWHVYIEPAYRHLIPTLEEEDRLHSIALSAITEYPTAVREVLDDDGMLRSDGKRGVCDLAVRLREMDREGIAAEIVFHGDPQIISMWTTVSNQPQPVDVQDAGRRAYHRWAADNLHDEEGRILLLGDAGPCFDMRAAVSELEWLKEHGFFGLLIPGFVATTGMAPLYDESYDRFWSACEDLGLVVAIHAAHGAVQGSFYDLLDQLANIISSGTSNSSSVIEEFVNNAETSFFAFDPRPRKALWDMMLGGVFDRHPKLRLLISEVRADWVPETLKTLDALCEQLDVPTRGKPSDYWHENCIAGMSFMKRSEVDMRGEIGIDRLLFGRDFPHPEGTWPKTLDHLRALLDGIPELEARALLGENGVNFFNLDRTKLARIAERIGAPTPEDLLLRGEDVDLSYVAAFHSRSGFLKPAENVDLRLVEQLVRVEFS